MDATAQNDEETRRVYTPKQIIRLTGLSRNKVYGALASGELPGAFRVGKRWLVSKRALDAILNGAPRGKQES
jgi:excisionase family DNA binding protein